MSTTKNQSSDMSNPELIEQFCKNAGVNDKETEYLVKFARTFESYNTLSTEELVKKALSRFLKSRNTDSIFDGIKQASDKAEIQVTATLKLLAGKRIKSAEDAALAAQLEKRAGGLWNTAKAIGTAGKNLLSAGRGVVPEIAGFASGAGRGVTRGAEAMSHMPRSILGMGGMMGRAAEGAVPNIRAMGSAGRAAGNVAKEVGGLGNFARKAMPFALGAGAGIGANKAMGFPEWYSKNYGAQYGERQALQNLMPYIMRSQDPAAMIQYMQRLTQLGGQLPEDAANMLQGGLAFQMNPYMYA